MDDFKVIGMKKFIGIGGWKCPCCTPQGPWKDGQSWKHHIRRYARHRLRNRLRNQLKNIGEL